MFVLTDTTLETTKLKKQLANPGAGACVTFEGWVRDHNEGKEVNKLEYEAYEKLATKEALKIIAEAKEKFEILHVHCVHRIGLLEIGEIAVWIGVSSAHRGPAFDACEYVINQIKFRVPIWKKEYYQSGDSGWVACHHCAHATSVLT